MKKLISFISNNIFVIIMGFAVILVIVCFFLPLFLSIGISMWGEVINVLQGCK